ncbi:Metallo-dependent hydrolase [Wolfiporia cocos MD-104 SS10]|uniref:Metallo-dependent hydrolase n=1 Tax=Wolfiporia cocos (strain MD-104) TaxID=742152 RepID=A0A2H3JBZ9_WOLCO|nr:Metallo-dependent hydrolase [Wolfiporia cocos MD-104 SS10]
MSAPERLHPLPADRGLLAHVIDAHCHPTDSPLDPATLAALPHRVCAMATRASDQPLVRALARAHPDRVVPCFGYHPWFVHWIALDRAPSHEAHYRALFLPGTEGSGSKASEKNEAAFARLLPYLPEPVSLEDVLKGLRADLEACPGAMLGEVGLDRVCRIPYSRPAEPPYASHEHDGDGSGGGRALSPFTTPLAHQVAVLQAQLALAVELRRNVSMHSVRAQQATIEVLAQAKTRFGQAFQDISVDMHSCGLSAQGWADIERAHPNVFLSLSTAINARAASHVDLLRAAVPSRILVESDFHDVALSAPFTWDMVVRVAEARGWRVEQSADEVGVIGKGGGPKESWGVVRRLAENWRAFEKGGHKVIPGRKQTRDKRKLLLDDSEEEESGDELDGVGAV